MQCQKPLFGIFKFQVSFILPSSHFVTRLGSWESHGKSCQTRRQQPSTLAGTFRILACRNSSIAMPYAESIGIVQHVSFTHRAGSFRATAPILTASDKISEPPSIPECDSLLHEIGDRIELADRDRKPTTKYRGENVSSSKTIQRKSASSLTLELCESYLSLPDKHPSSWEESDPKKMLIDLLLTERFDIDQESIASAMDNARSRPLRSSDILRLRNLCTPKYERIFHYILGSAKQDLGVAFLVKLRRDIRDAIHYWKFVQQNEEQDEQGKQRGQDLIPSTDLTKLQTLERNIQTILTSLFRPGVLDLQRITYQESAASIIEQIAFQEAVHPLQSLQDLKTRLGPGRRCFAFFHPALPNKPLVFVHVALLQEIPTSMSDLQYATESNATCATFYSITNTEPGLAGVDLGNHLIKSVVSVLQKEFPKLTSFSTLSPIPKFRNWLEGKIVRYHEGLREKQQSKLDSRHDVSNSSLRFMDDDLFHPTELQQLERIFSSHTPLLDLLETLKSPNWHIDDEGNDSDLVGKLQPILMKLAAYYLVVERHYGRPLCPVAKFHIRNGAEMYRLNYMADTTSKGMRNSCGMMINYHYLLDEIETNRTQYEINYNVMVKEGVKCCLNSVGPDHDN